MVNKLFTILLLSVLIIATGCKSNEEKASELIKTELSKTLYDFNSYDPIETTVTEAYQTALNDSSCYIQAAAVYYSMKIVNEAAEKAREAKEHMDIWGAPTYYSSSYSDQKYYKYRDEAKEQYEKVTAGLAVVKQMGVALEDSIKKLDDKKVIGWEVKHRFRCKTKGGHSTIGDYRYVIDKDFKKILVREDCDEDSYKEIRDIIETAEKNGFSEIDLN